MKTWLNYRMTNLQAAIGVAQLERIDDFVKIKRENGRYYYEQLSEIPDIQLPVIKTDYAENILGFPVALSSEGYKRDLDSIEVGRDGCRY